MEIALQLSSVDGTDYLHYIGPINEESEVHFSRVIEKLSKNVVINFRQVTYINSCGVRAWVNFMRELEKEHKVSYEECTSEIVLQMNMIPSFLGNSEVISVYASYECESCNLHEEKLLKRAIDLPIDGNYDLIATTCPKCNQAMELEELEEEYFAFLNSG